MASCRTILALGIALAPACTSAQAPALDPPPTRFEADIRAFEAADHETPPPRGGIVFIGSSSIKN